MKLALWQCKPDHLGLTLGPTQSQKEAQEHRPPTPTHVSWQVPDTTIAIYICIYIYIHNHVCIYMFK